MKTKFVILAALLVLVTGVFSVSAQDTFFGKTAEELFPIPDVAANELEQKTMSFIAHIY